MRKQTQRQQAVAVVAAEMIIGRIPENKIDDAISHCCWRFPVVSAVWSNLAENATAATINNFRRDVLNSVQVTK